MVKVEVNHSTDFNDECFSAGIGAGISLHEKALIPVFADAKVHVCQPGKWMPFLRCGAGYGWAVSADANGGIYLNPAIGLSYAVDKRRKLLVQVGYERHKLERLKAYKDAIHAAEFVEQLSHNTISLKIGVEF